MTRTVVSFGWLAFIVGMAYGDVGDMPSCKPFSVWMPVGVAFILGTAWFMGYWAGKDAGQS